MGLSFYCILYVYVYRWHNKHLDNQRTVGQFFILCKPRCFIFETHKVGSVGFQQSCKMPLQGECHYAPFIDPICKHSFKCALKCVCVVCSVSLVSLAVINNYNE